MCRTSHDTRETSLDIGGLPLDLNMDDVEIHYIMELSPVTEEQKEVFLCTVLDARVVD